MKSKIVIGTRGSRLALFQSELIRDQIKAKFPKMEISIKAISTTGDRILDKPMARIGDKGLFTREIEEQLLSEDIDLAVHSLKDLPTELPKGLEISAHSSRTEPRDCLVSRSGAGLAKLPLGSKVGTSSLRRASQILNLRPDLKLKDLRGNVETRLRKLKEGQFDAMVIAAAGLMRLSLGSEITEMIEPEIIIPAAGQGIIAVETKKGREDLKEILKAINNTDSEHMAKAERALLHTFGGGCRAPIGAISFLKGSVIEIRAYVGSLDGREVLRDGISGEKRDAEKLGVKLANTMLKNGAAGIIERARHEF